MRFGSFTTFFTLLVGVSAFSPSINTARRGIVLNSTPNGGAPGAGGQPNGPVSGVETIEYIINNDGTVEELVSGIKGPDCHKVTDAIREQLGELISTQPTEEFYEQDLYVNNEVEIKSETSWEGSSEW